mgnify:CR=1 FL=1
MNIYEKLQKIKLELLELNLKKSGQNKFAGFAYYELSDILPSIIKLCSDNQVFTAVTYNNEVAQLSAINAEKPEETVTISSPMRNLNLKGCNEIQSLGGVETYSRRYLYMTLFDITENDMFDCLGKQEKVYKCYIPRNVRLSEAPSQEETIFEYDTRSEGAKAYAQLVKEVITQNDKARR